MSATECAWCGTRVALDDGFRAFAPAGERQSLFCRLEHIVAWGIRGAHWQAGMDPDAVAADQGVSRCAFCDSQLADIHVLLVRARGEHRIPDGFCSVDHMVEWAKAGGRWAPPRDSRGS